MGHQLSKPTFVIAKKSRNSQAIKPAVKAEHEEQQQQKQQEEQLDQKKPQVARGSVDSLVASSDVRQIIIKIQLAKMENGNEVMAQEAAGAGDQMYVDTLNANEQIVNVTLGTGVAGAVGAGAGVASRTAGSSTEASKTDERQIMNNNNLAGSVASASAAVKTLQLHDYANDDDAADDSLLRRRRSDEGVDYCEVMEPQSQSQPRAVSEMLSNGTQRTPASSSQSGNSCCRSRSRKDLSFGAGTAAGITVAGASGNSKRRCCKCKCRDAFRGLRGMLESSSNSSSSSSASGKDKRESAASTQSRSKGRSSVDRRSTPATLGAGSGSAAATRLQSQRQRNSVAVADSSNHLAIWAAPANGQGNVIIHIRSPQQPQFMLDSCAAPLVTMGPNIRLLATPTEAAVTANLPTQPIEAPRSAPAPVPVLPVNAYGAGVTVHSQIDFMHCLVPDLERIINSSFYWGKMDRYEAERLLEGKPEGTFLLRDSAQEEFLFSVTFRKYGRSLHARIEQSGHKFSFDCHDPCVFTALTVTGLLEHYKDPTCVMFFEPCLTMPLHRRQTFSLQQLARATIVSNTSYDGINQLELPGRLKSYLKEYHYKQKLRVKPCDANTPAPYYANI